MSTQPHTSTLVFTDLDGTLLDHDDYSWQAAKASIDALKVRNIPIIINTSKTFYEVVELQKTLKLDTPFIVENGSAIYCPKSMNMNEEYSVFDKAYVRTVLGTERKNIVPFLQSIRETNHWRFESYSDWSLDDIVAHTGLSLKQAEQSIHRQFSEPLIWYDNEENFSHFEKCVRSKNFRLLRGGRFFHILGKSDKGNALKHLTQNYAQLSGLNTDALNIICLGDSDNDIDMLKLAHFPVWVRSSKHDAPKQPLIHTAILTETYGPHGWHEAITQILTILDANNGTRTNN